jgi:hypothetical protein
LRNQTLTKGLVIVIVIVIVTPEYFVIVYEHHGCLGVFGHGSVFRASGVRLVPELVPASVASGDSSLKQLSSADHHFFAGWGSLVRAIKFDAYSTYEQTARCPVQLSRLTFRSSKQNSQSIV